MIYARTVQLSPLVVLIAVLIGAKLAGILGALGAIPVAGAIQVILIDWQRSTGAHRRATAPAGTAGRKIPRSADSQSAAVRPIVE